MQALTHPRVGGVRHRGVARGAARHRALIAPLVSFTEMVRRHPNAVLVVAVPEYVPEHWWEQALRSRTALRLKGASQFRRDAVVISVPYHPERKEDMRA